MRTYEAFAEYLRDGRTDVEPGRPLCNNTRVYYHGEAPGQEIYIKYHATEILCFHPDGRIDVNLAGWHTRTTFDRLNEYSPFSFWRHRIRPKIDPETVINLDGGYRWYNTKKKLRLYHVPEETGKFCVHPDRRRSPHTYEYEQIAIVDGNSVYEPIKLQRLETWIREWEAERKREREARKRLTKEKAKHARRLRAAEDFLTRNRISDEMVREMVPRLATVELRSRALVTAIEEQRLKVESQMRESWNELAQAKREILRLEDLLKTTERERDEYMYQVNNLHYGETPPPPNERQRSIILEAQ